MKTIEQEINQKAFANIHVKSDINIMYTAGWVEGNLCRFFKKYGLSQQQYNVLRILRGQHPKAVMLTQITERMIDKMSNATRLVEKLKIKGYVTRELNERSRRQVDINITENGLELLKIIDEDMLSSNPFAHYDKLSHEEIEQLNTILDKIRN
jgi:DNA-binding MarR family transcriptional regulator